MIINALDFMQVIRSIKNPVYTSAVVRDSLWGGVMSFLKKRDKELVERGFVSQVNLLPAARLACYLH